MSQVLIRAHRPTSGGGSSLITCEAGRSARPTRADVSEDQGRTDAHQGPPARAADDSQGRYRRGLVQAAKSFNPHEAPVLADLERTASTSISSAMCYGVGTSSSTIRTLQNAGGFRKWRASGCPGSTEQLHARLGIAKSNGVAETELKEVIIHLAFYAGWPRAMSAIMVAKEVSAA